MVNVQGEQYHHNNPSLLTDQLYLAAARAISASVLMDLGITCIINATLELPTMAYHNQDCLQIAVEDRIASKLYVYFDLVADKINAVHNSKGKTMIYCRAGMSRSASLCIAYFIKYHGMSLDDAFEYVKKRRPIIHPNVGFMRQLREYESKLRNRSSRVHKKRDDLPKLMFAECCISKDDTRYDDYDTGIKIIKPRPKPRLPKVLLNEVLDLSTETYQITMVELCNFIPESEPQGSISCQGDECLDPSWFAAQSMCPVCLEEMKGIQGSTASSDDDCLKTPFTKISEPARIAVSHLNVCLDFVKTLDNEFFTISPSTMIASSFSVFTELLLPTAQVIEEVTLEHYVGQIPQAMNLKGVKSKPKTKIEFFMPLVVILEPTVMDSCGIFQRQKINNHLPIPSQKLPKPFPPSCASPKPVLKRSNSRLSIKLPGLNISPAPGKVRKELKQTVMPCLNVATCEEPALVLEHTGETLPSFIFYPITPKIEIFNSLSCPATHQASHETFEIVERDIHTTYKPEWFATVARKAVIPNISYIVEMPYKPLTEEVAALDESLMMMRKEYPYYFLVKRDPEAMEMFKASVEPSIDFCYYNAIAPKRATKTVCLIPRQGILGSNTKERSHVKRIVEPVINWASERCVVECDFPAFKFRPIEPVEYGQANPRFGALKTRCVASCWNASHFKSYATCLIPRISAQCYNANSISNMCNNPLYGVAHKMQVDLCEMNNLYCEPTVLTGKASMSLEIRNSGQGIVGISCLTNVEDDSVELVDIPDAIGDLNILKQQLLKQTDPVKISIWLDVFKRSVIRARPIYPFITITEMLSSSESYVVEPLQCLNTNLQPDINTGKSCPHIAMELMLATEVSEQPNYECCQHLDTTSTEVLLEEPLDTIALNSVLQLPASTFITLLEAHFIRSSPQRTKYFPTYANSTLASMHVVAVAASIKITGESDRLPASIPLAWMIRQPFQIITQLQSVALCSKPTVLSQQNDIELAEALETFETAEEVWHPFADQKIDSLFEPTDVFWFFEVTKDTIPEVSEKAIVPNASKVNYQLFLPDPEMAEKVGMAGFKADQSDAQLHLNHLKRPRDFQNGGFNRRVSFKEDKNGQANKSKPIPRPPMQRQNTFHANVASAAATATNKTGKPNERVGRNQRWAVATLNTSVNHADKVLESRRSRSSSRPAISGTSRQVKDTAKQESDNNVTLRGLLDVAQTWLSGYSSHTNPPTSAKEKMSFHPGKRTKTYVPKLRK